MSVSPRGFSSQFFDFAISAAKLYTSLAVLCIPAWFVVAPILDNYIQNVIEKASIPTLIEPLEFRGNGIVMSKGPFNAGDLVPILFLLKVNTECARTVEVRYINQYGSFVTELTEVVPATQSNGISSDFRPFFLGLRLPKNMEDGTYVYAAVIRTIGCEDDIKSTVVVPFSTLIEVRNEE